MRTIRRTFSNLSQSTLFLGRAGENLVTTLELDISKEQKEFSNPVFELVLKMPSSNDPYPVLVDVTDDKLTYSFTGSDLAESGFGELEALVCSEDGEVLKSTTAKTKIERSIIPRAYPGPIQKVINDILAAIGEIEVKSGIEVVDELPGTAEAGKLVYLIGVGIYRYSTEWERITKDDLEDTVYAMRDDIPSAQEIARWDYVAENAYVEENGNTLAKFSEADGELRFDNNPIGGGVPTVQHPSDLELKAQDGSVAVAVNDDDGIVYPEQISDEEVTVDVAGKPIRVGSPSFDSTAIGTAITAQDLPTATVEVSGEGNLSAVIVPVVADINNNDYTNAGMTLDPSQVVIATCTKNYSIGLMLVPNLVKPDKIVSVDADHVKLPFMAILAFENLSGDVYGLPGESLTAGWNIALATVDTATYSDITGIEIVTGIDINEYVSLKISDNNEMTIEGTSGVDIFRNIIVGNDGDSKGLYVKLGTWKRALLEESSEDDVTLLGLTTYENLVIRDDVLPDSIQDVPVFAGGDISLGGQLISIVDANENYVSLNDIDDADGLPVRYIKTVFNGTVKVWFPVATSPVSSAISYPRGWSEGGVSTTAPSFAGFTPTHIEYKNTSYTDVGTLPAEVKSALRSLSQCINVTKEAMGSISVPEDSVARFNGTIELNRKYYFNTSMDFALDLPTVPFAEEDAQFAIYLKTDRSVDMLLPSDALVSGEIDTSDGNHKLIGCYDKTVNKWCIGCVDYEVAE